MKKPFSHFNTVFFFALPLLFTGVMSCKKESIQINQPSAPSFTETRPADSISYSIDGVTYTCDLMTGESIGTAGANLDTTNGGWKWDVDTVQYRKSYSYNVSSGFQNGNAGTMKIYFTKKFVKTQLTRQNVPGILSPDSDTVLYTPKGFHSYAVDFDRYNRQNGVALEFNIPNGGLSHRVYSYSTQLPRLTTLVTADSQKDSKFEVINFSYVPAYQGWLNCYLLEAKFSCNVYDRNEQPHVVTGYLRIHVQ